MLADDLRKSVLQAAIEGRLVEQHDSEGSVDELIDSISCEKERLIKEKIIKKQKELLSISEEEIPFDIPESWRWVRLGDICFKITDGSHNPPPNRGQGIPMISAKNIVNGNIDFSLTNRFINDEEFEKEDRRTRIRRGDLLLCIVGSIGRSVVVDIDVRISCQRSVAVLKTGIYNYYLRYVLESPTLQSVMMEKSTGTAQKGIYLEVLKNLIIPIPPLEEQKRIVAKIEEIMKEIDQYEVVEKELQSLKQAFPGDLKKSLLQAAIQGKLVEQHNSDGNIDELINAITTERERLIKEKVIKKPKSLPPISEDEIPFEIPDSWRWIRLGDIGDWGAGATPLKSKCEYYGGTMPWLKTGELTDGEITEHIECVTELALKETSLRINKPGDVLIAMYGATIGKLGILTFEATTNQACCACTPFTGVYNKYLFYYLMAIRENFKAISEGGAQPNISKEKISKTLFPLPPLTEQKRIVEKLEQLLPLCDELI